MHYKPLISYTWHVTSSDQHPIRSFQEGLVKELRRQAEAERGRTAVFSPKGVARRWAEARAATLEEVASFIADIIIGGDGPFTPTST